MGVVIPQVITSDRASGAQVIDGSLKFDNSKTTNLSRTPGSEGNRKPGRGVVGLIVKILVQMIIYLRLLDHLVRQLNLLL